MLIYNIRMSVEYLYGIKNNHKNSTLRNYSYFKFMIEQDFYYTRILILYDLQKLRLNWIINLPSKCID